VAALRGARRVWAVGAVHADAARLSRLHARLEARVWRGDRLVYLGNVIGLGQATAATLRELLLFRRAILARPGFEPEDIVVLRGSQEQMLTRTLDLQFAEGPAAAEQALAWMGAHGLAPVLAAYGSSIEEGLRIARQGPMAIGRWTAALRARIRETPGHDPLLAGLARAAVTVPLDLAGEAPGMLMVASGLDPARPFAEQGDAFWWRADGFLAVAEGVPAGEARAGWAGFARIVRGLDPAGGGLAETPFAVTLDAGCGRGGMLACGLFAPDGALLELIEV
jgi:serine/threonine protein phosphatase 1